MASGSRALVKEGVYYNGGATLRPAPFGEYEVERDADGLVRFSSAESDECFKLSLDAVMQHVCEGRILLLGGRIARAQSDGARS